MAYRDKFEVRIHTKSSPLTCKQIILYFKKIISILPELKNYFITIAIINDLKMQELNRKFTGRNTSTDVLSFRYEGSIPTIEVIVSADQAVKNAPRYKNTPARELLLYVIHGILHGLGYDDNDNKDRIKMFRKQREILNRVWNE